MVALSYEDARSALMRRRLPTFSDARDALNQMMAAVQVTLAYQKLFPDDFRERLKVFLPGCLADNISGKTLARGALEAVEKLFPLAEGMMEDSDFSAIYVEAWGSSMSWDDYAEMVEDGDGLAEYRDDAFPIFLWAIAAGVGPEDWEKLSDGLGWGTPYPEAITDRYFDFAQLSAQLDAVGLGIFVMAFNVAYRDTGCLFWDIDSANGCYENSPAFTAENICNVKEEYEMAQQINDQYGQAMSLLHVDPGIYGRLVEIMAASLKEESEDDNESESVDE